MDQNVVFRATNFTGGSNGFRSFSERMDRKERYKQLDALQAKKDAENLRRYDIAQNRLDIQEGRAAESHDSAMANNEIVRQKNELALSEANSGVDRRKNAGQLISDTPTAMVDKVNQQALDIMDSNKTSSEKDSMMKDYNNKLVANHESGKIDLNKVYNPANYSQKIITKLINEGYTPQEATAQATAATQGAMARQKTATTAIDSADNFSKAIFDKEMTESNKNTSSKTNTSKPPKIDALKLSMDKAFEELDNPWGITGGYYETPTVSKDKDGFKTFEFKGSSRIGEQELGRAINDVANSKFQYKTKDGKLKERFLTELELKGAFASSFDEGVIMADNLDAKKLFTTAQKIVNDNGFAGNYNKSKKKIMKDFIKNRDDARAKYGTKTAGEDFAEIFGKKVKQ